jgi:3-methyladenine DNA glycosylase AlkD
MKLSEIQKILREKTNKKTRLSFEKFVPSSKKVYGVRIPTLNKIVKEIKEPNFELIRKLWKSGAFEERLLAAKILGGTCKKDPEKTLKLIKKFSKDISDWAVCDTLATQGIRKIVKEKEKEIFNLSKELISSKNFWQRRFAIVLLIELSRQGFDKQKIEKLLKKVENDKDDYVQKARSMVKNRIKITKIKKEQFEIQRAIKFLIDRCLDKEGKQKIPNPKPVVVHSLRMGFDLLKRGYSKDVVIGAILHDLEEGAGVSIKEIEKKFGKKVAKIVEGVSFNPEITNNKERYLDTYKRIVKAGKEAIIVSVADHIDNADYYKHVKSKMTKRKVKEKWQIFLKDVASKIKDEPIYKELKEKMKNL